MIDVLPFSDGIFSWFPRMATPLASSTKGNSCCSGSSNEGSDAPFCRICIIDWTQSGELRVSERREGEGGGVHC